MNNNDLFPYNLPFIFLPMPTTHSQSTLEPHKLTRRAGTPPPPALQLHIQSITGMATTPSDNTSSGGLKRRRTRSNHSDHEDERATKRLRPSTSTRSLRRTRHLPEFVEGSSRGTGRKLKRQKTASRGSQPPPQMARGPSSVADERELEADLKDVADKLWEVFWNIHGGAKLRGHDMRHWGLELGRMVECSRRELGLIAARTLPDPDSWNHQAPTTLPPFRATIPPLSSILEICSQPSPLHRKSPPLHSIPDDLITVFGPNESSSSSNEDSDPYLLLPAIFPEVMPPPDPVTEEEAPGRLQTNFSALRSTVRSRSPDSPRSRPSLTCGALESSLRAAAGTLRIGKRIRFCRSSSPPLRRSGSILEEPISSVSI